jgi:hypothetical protein
LHPLKQQPDELLFGLDAAPFKHAELNDGVAVGASGGKEKIGTIQRKEPVGPFVSRILKRIHDTRMNDIRELPLDGIKLLFQSKNFNLGHKVLRCGLVTPVVSVSVVGSRLRLTKRILGGAMRTKRTSLLSAHLIQTAKCATNRDTQSSHSVGSPSEREAADGEPNRAGQESDKQCDVKNHGV